MSEDKRGELTACAIQGLTFPLYPRDKVKGRKPMDCTFPKAVVEGELGNFIQCHKLEAKAIWFRNAAAANRVAESISVGSVLETA